MSRCITVAGFLLCALLACAQECATGEVNLAVKDGLGTSHQMGCYQPPPSSGGVPAGAILLISSGSCPAGFAEASELNGKFLLGTLAANADAGTTGGADAVTPAGTNSAPVLAMDPYTPAGTNSAPALTMNPYTPAGTNSGAAVAAHSTQTTKSASTGTNQTTVSTATHSVTQPAFTGTSATLTGSVAAPTFTGTPATLTGSVSPPTFTGVPQDNRPAFIKVIFCRKT